MMRALVVTGSRADRNGLEVVHEALLKAGHEVKCWLATGGPTVVDYQALFRTALLGFEGDVAIVAGDRYETLINATALSLLDIPIAHIAGGDITEGSKDDRYRDAITALSCIHFATNAVSFNRLTGGDYEGGPLIHKGDSVYQTGSPAIDRIKQTPVLDRYTTFAQFGAGSDGKWALVCVHPNTTGDDPLADWRAVSDALIQCGDLQIIALGANADKGGADINSLWQNWNPSIAPPRLTFRDNVSPQLYYSLMTHCDVMVGNSSAMLYEAPCFGLPCVLVGDRQKGRPYPPNIILAPLNEQIVPDINIAIKRGRLNGCSNPYGDGNSAPRIVKALEENSWRWS